MRIDRLVDAIAADPGGATRTALVTEDGRHVGYADLAGRIDAAASALASLGLGPGQRAVLVGENSLDMVVLLLAVARLGAWAVPLNARMSAPEIDAICDHAEPALVYFATDSSAEATAHAQRLDARAPDLPPLRAGRVAVSPGASAEPVDGSDDDVAVMLYTSGSTGTPKGVMLTHANLDFVTRTSCDQKVLHADDQVFDALPLSHSFGLVSVLLSGLRAGATLHLVTRFSAPKLAAGILDGGITVFQGVPAMYARLQEWAVQNDRSLTPNRLRLLYIGGSQVDATRKAESEALLGLPLHHGYGLTEAAPTATRTFGHPPPDEVTAGWPVPGVEVVLRDQRDRSVATGERGEVWIRGPNIMKGYFRDPVQTRAAVDADGWLHTGDIGVFRPQGDLQIVGRIKEMIIRGGFNVYPAEVEAAIGQFPGVAQCAVLGAAVPDDEEVVAFVEPQAGQSVDVGALKAFLRDRLVGYKVPTRYAVIERLPASGTGKLLKASMRSLLPLAR